MALIREVFGPICNQLVSFLELNDAQVIHSFQQTPARFNLNVIVIHLDMMHVLGGYQFTLSVSL